MINPCVTKTCSYGTGLRHGICRIGKERRLGLPGFLVALFFICSCALGLQGVRADLRLYIEIGSDNLTVVDNGVGDDDLSLGSIIVSAAALDQVFPDWIFATKTASSTLGTNNADAPVRRLNLQFDALNNSGSEKSLEVKVLYTGSLGSDQKPTALNLFATGTMYQNYNGTVTPAPDPPPPFDIRVAGAFNQDENASYETNGYDDLTGPPLWVLGAKGLDIEFGTITPEGATGFNVVDPYNAEIIPAADGLYSLTLASFAGGIQDGERFGIQSDLEITLPEPISVLSWGGIGVAVLWTSRRRRMP